MVPKIDPLYFVGRLIRLLCYPVAWAASRMPQVRPDADAVPPRGDVESAPTPHRRS